MCSYVTCNAEITGSAYAKGEWIDVNKAVVGIEHPLHANVAHAIVLDFRTDDPATRVAVELDSESARQVAESILAALNRA